MKRETGTCALCHRPACVTLDGDKLCREHANSWVRGEGQAVQEQLRAEREGD